MGRRRGPVGLGDSQRSRLNVSTSSTSVNLTGVEELEQLILGVVHPDTAVRLAGASEGDRSMVVIQSSELSYDALLRAVEAWYDDMATLESSGLGLSPVRVEAAEQAEASSGCSPACSLCLEDSPSLQVCSWP